MTGDERKLQRHLKVVNKMILGASTTGTYCLGMTTVEALRTGMFPRRRTMERLSKCRTIAEEEALISRMTETKGKRQKESS